MYRDRSEPRVRQALWGDVRGLSSVEYVVALVLVAAVAVGAWRIFGEQVRCALVLHGFPELAESPEAMQKCLGPQESLGDAVAGGEGSRRSAMSRGCDSIFGPSPQPSPPPSPAPPKPTPPAPPAPPTPADQMIQDLKNIMCPQDKAFLQELQRRAVSINAYDSIYADDQYYDGKKWTTRRIPLGGETRGTHIVMERTNPTNDAALIVHEGVHTGQPSSMPRRDKEYEAYTKEEEWRIAHNLPPGGANFRTVDSSGKVVPNVPAIRVSVDNDPTYAGISVPAPKKPGKPRPPPDEIIGFDAKGNTKLERADGTTYTRPPRKGDGFQGPTTTVPPTPIVVDINKLQCP